MERFTAATAAVLYNFVIRYSAPVRRLLSYSPSAELHPNPITVGIRNTVISQHGWSMLGLPIRFILHIPRRPPNVLLVAPNTWFEIGARAVFDLALYKSLNH